MASNRGATSLKCKRRTGRAMSDYDRLPKAVRAWVSTAALPWRVGSVRAAYKRALAEKGDPHLALQELDRLQNALLAKDAMAVWGGDHPATSRQT
jgi:hypothetical protein